MFLPADANVSVAPTVWNAFALKYPASVVTMTLSSPWLAMTLLLAILYLPAVLDPAQGLMGFDCPSPRHTTTSAAPESAVVPMMRVSHSFLSPPWLRAITSSMAPRASHPGSSISWYGVVSLSSPVTLKAGLFGLGFSHTSDAHPQSVSSTGQRSRALLGIHSPSCQA